MKKDSVSFIVHLRPLHNKNKQTKTSTTKESAAISQRCSNDSHTHVWSNVQLLMTRDRHKESNRAGLNLGQSTNPSALAASSAACRLLLFGCWAQLDMGGCSRAIYDVQSLTPPWTLSFCLPSSDWEKLPSRLHGRVEYGGELVSESAC